MNENYWYNVCLNGWIRGYAAKEKIHKFVDLKKITAEQYQEIISNSKEE